MIFTTQRLSVRKLEKNDLDLFHKLQSDHHIMRYVGGKTFSLEENRKDLDKIVKFYSKPSNNFWVWAITLKENNLLIGTCVLIKNDKGENEIGYRLLKEYWGKGIGKEITNGLIKYSFEVLRLKEIIAYVDKKNAASIKIIDATFRFIKEFYNDEDNCIDRYYKLSN
ncbi:GNAT family N-acetyltransferase [Abyssalbus ytuae]|uniref:GNAT family N-acetyltransferase n=1 Tax=Abyssalbus ytuae TaxID=2926907 RepID=A0A9E7CTZ6_9FLAO|nr:GNAT family N-acetyltransferase [Abyssalbus ytuae]UOB17217.1 GNAT family N-acetyltransferase [Abyssalbus ytuae]